MEKTKNKSSILSERAKQIDALKEEMKRLKEEGTFKQFYYSVRKGCVDISKKDISENDQKKEMAKLLEKNLEEIKKNIE